MSDQFEGICADLFIAAAGSMEGGAKNALVRGLAGLYRRGLQRKDIAIDEPIDRQLESAARREAFDVGIHAERVGEVLAVLEAWEVRPLVLRGRALATAVWPDPAFRPTGDLDVLVPAASSKAAEGALGSIGFRPAGLRGRPHLGVIEHSHEYARTHGGPVPLTVDLHTELFRSIGNGIRATDVLARILTRRARWTPGAATR